MNATHGISAQRILLLDYFPTTTLVLTNTERLSNHNVPMHYSIQSTACKSTITITNTAEVTQEWLHCVAAVDNLGLMCLTVQSLWAAITMRHCTNVP